MSDFPPCTRRGEKLNEDTCECFSNRIYHPMMGIAHIQTCNICPYKNMEDDPDLPKVDMPDGPSLIDMAKSFSKAVAKHVKNKMEKVTDEQYEIRMKICESCDYLKDRRCTQKSCGCFITRKAKWVSEECPIDKWPKLD